MSRQVIRLQGEIAAVRDREILHMARLEKSNSLDDAPTITAAAGISIITPDKTAAFVLESKSREQSPGFLIPSGLNEMNG